MPPIGRKHSILGFPGGWNTQMGTRGGWLEGLDQWCVRAPPDPPNAQLRCLQRRHHVPGAPDVRVGLGPMLTAVSGSVGPLNGSPVRSDEWRDPLSVIPMSKVLKLSTPRARETSGSFRFALVFLGLDTSVVTTHRIAGLTSAYATRNGSLPSFRISSSVRSLAWPSSTTRDTSETSAAS